MAKTHNINDQNQKIIKSKEQVIYGRDDTNRYNISKQLQDEEGFTPKESRASLKRRMKNENDFGLVGAPPTLSHIWLYNVAHGNIDTIKSYLKAKNINVGFILKKSHEKAKYKSFKITVYKSDINKLLDENFWPNRVKCRLWKELKNNRVDSVSFFGNKYKYLS